jgi:glutamate racemase
VKVHLIITDSGLGGLTVCAEIERNLRLSGRGPADRITYFNAWPEQRSGYNDLPDMRSQARIFDRALETMAAIRPERILIACNTLSIIYDHTEFSRATRVPVTGIIDAGVELFYEALAGDPSGTLILLGTRTTINSGVHRDRLLEKGIDPQRILPLPCPGLAAAIERDPDGNSVEELFRACYAQRGGTARLPGRLYAGFCCTHYNYVSDRLHAEMERLSGRDVHVLDPNVTLARQVAPRERQDAAPACGTVAVEVISKIELPDSTRLTIAARLAPVSEPTARALLAYHRIPDLF